MNNFVINESVLHYAAAFLERWEDKAPNEENRKAQKELRALSNYLLDNLYAPMYIAIVRHNKKK
jgi:hypothetical protein